MFDFQMKHSGEIPARHLAQVRLWLKQENFPMQLAEDIAPVVETPDDLEAIRPQLEAAIGLFTTANVSGDKALTILREALAEMTQAATNTDQTVDGETDVSASLSFGANNKNKMTLSSRIYQKLRNSGPKISIDGRGSSESRFGNPQPNMRAALSDALQSRFDRRHQPTVGRAYAALSMGEIAMAAANAAGLRPRNIHEAVRMSTHTSSDFPLILEDAIGRSVARQLEQITPALARAAHEVAAVDYRPGNMLSLSASGMPGEIGEGGEIRHVTIDENGERKPAPRDFGAMFRISNKAIVNDDIGMFDQIAKQMTAGAIERQRNVLLEPLLANSGLGHNMADGKTVFHADHGNLAAAGAALSITSLSAARLALRSQRGKQGEYYAIEPWALVVPPNLETVAQQVLAEIKATVVGDVNPFSGSLDLIVEVGLTNPNAWYLIGNPANTDGLAYSYLDGEAAPRIESKPGWDTLGAEFRLVWALDAKFVSYASWFKNPGA